MNNYKIYGLSEPDGETIRYIGFTARKLKERLNEHCKIKKQKTYKNSWIKGLRLKNQKPIIHLIENGLTYDESIEKEKHYIKMFKSFGAKLVNGTEGGIGGKTNINRKFTIEHKNKISNSLLGHLVSENTKIKLRNSNSCKSILQYDLENNLLNEFQSIGEASKKLNISFYNISSVCKKERKTAGGYIWKYRNNGICPHKIINE